MVTFDVWAISPAAVRVTVVAVVLFVPLMVRLPGTAKVASAVGAGAC